MRLLDLFCGAGGAAMGYHQAGFTTIVGVDLAPQPRYPFTFVQADALEYVAVHGQEFDAIHASPPCQAYTTLKNMWNAHEHTGCLPETRLALRTTQRPYVIENVPGAPIDTTLLLCGSMFNLGCDVAELRRHRLFESTILLWSPGACQHGRRTIMVTGSTPRDPQLESVKYRKKVITVTGHTPVENTIRETFSVAEAREAMGIDWMVMAELTQAIPPAYTEYIGRQLLMALEGAHYARHGTPHLCPLPAGE